MAAFDDAQAFEEKKAVNQGLTQMRSAIVSVRAKLQDFQSLRTKWAAGVASGAYAQADLDKLDSILVVLAQFTPVVDQFLATDLGV